ncbi:MAG: GFA family protein [Xanthobacteraceae bacterium]
MTDEDKPVTGRCLCGDIRYEYRGAPLKVLHCHCESCRRHTSSPVAPAVCVTRDSFRYTKGEPVTYVSSPGVRRTHCGRCGSPMTYESDRNMNQVDIFIGTLDDPASVAPTYHVHVEEQLPWFEVADAAPRYARGKTGNEPVRHGPKPIK